MYDIVFVIFYFFIDLFLFVDKSDLFSVFE